MLRNILFIACLLSIFACRELPAPSDRAACIPEWSNSAGVLPHFGDFIAISILDSKLARLNNSPPKRLEKIIEDMASNVKYIKETPIRVSVKDCTYAMEIYLRMKNSGLCLRDNCRFAPKWNFPS